MITPRSATGITFLWLALLLSPSRGLGATSGSATITLAWNPNPETDVVSYQLSYGTSAGVHSTVVNAGATTTATVTGLIEGTTYYFVVTATNLAGLQSQPSAEAFYQIPVTQTDSVTVIPRSGWSLRYVDSQAVNGYAATNAFDGNPNTLWATDYLNAATQPPHEIQIDLGAIYPVGGFRYLPRQDAYSVGNIGQYEFYLSMDGTQWGAPAASGSFADTKTEKEVLFGSVGGRYVRLRILTEVSGDLNCAVAELNVLQGAAITPPPIATTLAAWAAAANLTALDINPLAAPQHDGIVNLLKYAFCMNGTAPDVTVLSPGTGTTGLPFIAFERSGTTTVLHFEYLRRKNSSLIYTPRKSLDLQTWLPLSATTPLVIDLDAEWERVVIAEPCDPAAPACFGRVEVLLPTL
ncbi:MAG: discoidin domain-containing protein [Verrucomicrobiota bacterium]